MQGSFLLSFIKFGVVVLENKCQLQINKSAILLLLLLVVVVVNLGALLHLVKYHAMKLPVNVN